MAEFTYFTDNVQYTEADQAYFQQRVLRPQGVFLDSPDLPEFLSVAAIGGMSVRVGRGEAMVQGFYYLNNATKDLVIGANASGSTRVDTVVLKLDRGTNQIVAQVKVGTPGAGAPALTQVSGGTWEFPLADVSVANGVGSIISANITDRRVASRWSINALASDLASDAELASEAATRSTADTTITNNLNAEITNRGTAVTNEANTRASADTTLQANINTEVTNRTNDVNTEEAARIAADADLQDQISLLSGSDTSFIDDLNDEIANRIAGDNTLQSNINAEAANRASADTTITNSVSSEATTRANADSSEASTRAAADTTLQNNINSEASTRTAALVNEANARANADSTLTTNLNNEITNRQNADTTLQNNINSEATTRANADSSEATTRAAADTGLQSGLSSEAGSRINADIVLQNNINAEAAARAALDPKAFALIRHDHTILDDYRITSITHLGTGFHRIDFAVPMASADYIVFMTADTGMGGGAGIICYVNDKQTDHVDVSTASITGAGVETSFSIIVFGG